MKTLKITLATLALTLFANFSMAQQESKTPEEIAANHTEKLAEKLLLTPDQKAQVAEINLAIVRKNEAVKADKNMSEETRTQSIQGNNDARIQMIKPILNAEQLVKFEEMEAKRAQRTHYNEQKLNMQILAPAPTEPTSK